MPTSVLALDHVWEGGKLLQLKLTAPKHQHGDPQAPVDIVFVLDVSGSMEGEKLAKLKQTMDEILKRWMHSEHRVGVVSFARRARVECHMNAMNSASKEKVLSAVSSLYARGGTNLQLGLDEGLKLLKAEGIAGHSPIIFFLSDGEETCGGDATKVRVQNVRVDTFGYGVTYGAEVLATVSANSHGGGYHNAYDWSKLTSVFSPSFFAATRNVIIDLEVTVEQQTNDPIEQQGSAMNITGTNHQVRISHHSTRLEVGALFSEQETRYQVTWAQNNNGNDVKVSWTYKDPRRNAVQPPPGGKTIPNPKMQSRTRSLHLEPQDSKTPRVIKTESTRLNHVAAIKEVKALADAQQLEEARDKLGTAINVLDDVLELPDADVSKKTIGFLYTELEELIVRMHDQAMYNQKGLPYLLACISSHDRQCPTTRCYAGTIRLFYTPLMDKYLDEAMEIEENTA